MKSKFISRRNFLKLSGVIAGSTMIALTPGKAFGWVGFEFAEKSSKRVLLVFNMSK